MTKKVLYFLAGALPTGGETTAIGKLNAMAEKPYDVQVRRGDAVGSGSYGAGIEDADYVAGTPPAGYASTETYPRINPDAPPHPDNLPATQAVVANTQQLTIPITGTYATKITLTVAGGVVTAGVLS